MRNDSSYCQRCAGYKPAGECKCDSPWRTTSGPLEDGPWWFKLKNGKPLGLWPFLWQHGKLYDMETAAGRPWEITGDELEAMMSGQWAPAVPPEG